MNKMSNIKKRHIYQLVKDRCLESRKCLQVLIGPRQVGKTTLIQQVLSELDIPSHYASADKPTLQDAIWLEQQWEVGRSYANEADNSNGALLVLDEIQKIFDWPGYVKDLWDTDTRTHTNLKVVILGSAPLLMQQGLNESLAGRFETIPITHWSFVEVSDAFGLSLDEYIYFGAYPGAMNFIQNRDRWQSYIYDSLIETTISRDILLLNRVDKPALLRRLFELGCSYSSQILSFQKMLGQLQDVGNATTLAHYLKLLSGAGMLSGLSKYSGAEVRKKGSSPKLQVLNTALMTSQSQLTFEQAKKDPEYWGRLVESAVGADLLNRGKLLKADVYYWRDRNQEVDFVVCCRGKVTAIEVKSIARQKSALPGFKAFSNEFNVDKKLLLGAQGIPLTDYFTKPLDHWLLD